ncbi:MAG: FHA domain-containing protein [Coriobacteriales bacterium]|nr:FHA domain-containing protein [Coriobacteriales bacterium]
MNDYTLFGEFVNSLDEYLDARNEALGTHALAKEIMGPTDDYQTTRFLRGKIPYHRAHKGAICQILENGMDECSSSLLQRIGRSGHKLVVERGDDQLVQMLSEAIDKARGSVLTDVLLKHPLTPGCVFCKRMYGLYNRYYGVTQLESTDLERYISSSAGTDEAESLTIYRRLLLATLLGPEAVPAINRFAPTAVFGEELLGERVDGFELCQLVLRGDEFADTNVCAFGRGVEVLVGRGYNTDAAYAPIVVEGVESRVSYEHAVIRPSYAGGAYSWELVNLSESNGTAVWRVGKEPIYSRERGNVMPLGNGDEIWLAPVSKNGKWLPDCKRGAILRFDVSSSFVHVLEDEEPVAGTTPIFDGGESGTSRVIYGFSLKNVRADSDWQNYSFADIKDDEGYFSFPIGRSGGFEVPSNLGSNVSGRHAVIDPGEDDGRVSLRNSSNKNDIVVIGADGAYTLKVRAPGDVILSNNDEILLAGVVENGKPCVSTDGAVVRFRYLFRRVSALLKPDFDCPYPPLIVESTGVTIGLVRPRDGETPTIELPNIKGFEYASMIHGRFDFEDGVWMYTQLGKNDTRVLKPDGSDVVLEMKNSSTTLPYGSKLSFVGSPCYIFLPLAE